MKANDMKELVQEVRGLRADVHAMRQEMERYRGFVAGVVWCFSGIAALVGFLWGHITGNA